MALIISAMTALTLIAALDGNRAIGRSNTLPWKLPRDLKRFKDKTLGKPLLMGSKTAQSLGRALPGRLNLVLTRSGRVPFEGMEAVSSLDEALERASGEDELMVIGGGEVYTLALPLAQTLMLTHVDTATPGADAFFPSFDPSDWVEVSREDFGVLPGHDCPFSFVDYRRR